MRERASLTVFIDGEEGEIIERDGNRALVRFGEDREEWVDLGPAGTEKAAATLPRELGS